MLAELKDLGEKGLFSSSEIKHILKKRTAFEMALVRRIPNKNDYLRYAAYEMGLEALRRKRAARLSASLTQKTHNKKKLRTHIKRDTQIAAIDIGLRANAQAVSHIRACPTKVQVGRLALATVSPNRAA